MKLQKTIEECIRDYPSLYPSRSAVLDHLFCSYGNGYDWVNGELVDIFEEERDENKALWIDSLEKAQKEFEDAETDIDRYIIGSLVEMYEEKVAEHRVIREEYMERASKEYVEERYTRWCPMCKYSGLVNFPDDIKPDWAAGIKEAAYAILALPEEEWSMSKYGNWESMLTYADQALTRLEEVPNGGK